MSRTTKDQANTALRAFKATAERFGLDYSEFDFVKYPSGYGLQREGETLLIPKQLGLSQWYDILNAADEALKAVENLREKQVRDQIHKIKNGNVKHIVIDSNVSANVLDVAYENGVGVTIKDDAFVNLVQLPLTD